MTTVPHGSWNPGRPEPGHVGDPRGEERDPPGFEFAPGAFDVAAHQSHVGDARTGDAGSSRPVRRDCGSRILEQLDDVVVDIEPHDRCPHHDRGRNQLAHVLFDLRSGHLIGRREHPEPEDVRIPPGRLLDVGNADGHVGESSEHPESVWPPAPSGFDDRTRGSTGSSFASAPPPHDRGSTPG